MNEIEIRKIKNDEVGEVVDIWFDASIKAHSFIAYEYWEKNKSLMENKYIPMTETYVSTNSQIITGFISLLDEYLAAIFVKPDMQGNGIGSLLLAHVKNIRKKLQLKVFCKNLNSISFYETKGFSIISEFKDEETGENELLMEWQK